MSDLNSGSDSSSSPASKAPSDPAPDPNLAPNLVTNPAKDPKVSKALCVISHFAALFSYVGISMGVPLLIFFLSENETVKDHAMESLNFQLNMFVWSLIGWFLAVFGVGLIILAAVVVASVIMPILAMIRVGASPTEAYRYPLVFRLVN